MIDQKRMDDTINELSKGVTGNPIEDAEIELWCEANEIDDEGLARFAAGLAEHLRSEAIALIKNMGNDGLSLGMAGAIVMGFTTGFQIGKEEGAKHAR